MILSNCHYDLTHRIFDEDTALVMGGSVTSQVKDITDTNDTPSSSHTDDKEDNTKDKRLVANNNELSDQCL